MGEPSDVNITFPQPIATRDVEAFEIARQQNAAANGRLFCFMIFAACLLLWIFTSGNRFMYLGLISTLPVGLSIFVDSLPAGPLRSTLSGASVGISLSVFISLWISIG